MPVQAGMLLVCLLVWPVSAWMKEKRGWIAFALPVLSGMGCLLAPGMALPAVWCAGGLMALLLLQTKIGGDAPRWQREGAIWGGMAVLSAVALIICLNGRYPQGIHLGLAAELTSAIGGGETGPAMLYQFYQMGLVDVDPSIELIHVAEDGTAWMTQQGYEQLLYGLRSLLEDAMQLMIPTWTVNLIGLTTLFCVTLPVRARRRRGEKDDTPRLEQWSLPRKTGRRMLCLYMGGLLPLLWDSAVMMTMAQLMIAAAGLIFSVLGAATLRFASKRAGRRPGVTWSMILLAAIFAPQLMAFLGVIDQALDLRKLRQNQETEEDRE